MTKQSGGIGSDESAAPRVSVTEPNGFPEPEEREMPTKEKTLQDARR
jgi:hypothetical protein